MLQIVEQNLLTSDYEVIGHQCNCQKVMGSGIALQIKKAYPKAYEVFQHDIRLPKDKLGSFCYHQEDDMKAIFNLYGQLQYGKGKCFTNYDALESSVTGMVRAVMEFEPSMGAYRIALPYGIGCGLAGGNWPKVYGLLENICTMFNRDIYLCKI